MGVDQTAAADLSSRLAHTLAHTIEDLDGYIQLRAEELAAPLVQAARAEADTRVAAMAGELQRQNDVADELRRIIAVRDRQLAALVVAGEETRTDG